MACHTVAANRCITRAAGTAPHTALQQTALRAERGAFCHLPVHGQVPESTQAHESGTRQTCWHPAPPRRPAPYRAWRVADQHWVGGRQTFSQAVGELPFVTSAGFVLHGAVALRLSQNKLSRIGVPWGGQGGDRWTFRDSAVCHVPAGPQSQLVPARPLSSGGSRCHFRTDESRYLISASGS